MAYLESKFNPMALAVSHTARTGALNSLQYTIGFPMIANFYLVSAALTDRQPTFDTAARGEYAFICETKIK